MAEASGSAANCTARLPLLITENGKVLPYPQIERITEELNKDIAHLRNFIFENGDLQRNVNITGVIYEDNTAFIILNFESPGSLQKFYESTTTQENQLTNCLVQFFDKQKLQLAAGLKLTTKLTLTVSMSEDEYSKLKNVFKSIGPQSRLKKMKEMNDSVGGNDDLKTENNSEYTKHLPPCDSQTRAKKAIDEGTTGKVIPLMEKKFILYYPDIRGRVVSKVVLIFPKFTNLNLQMTSRKKAKRLYETVVQFPSNIFENDKQVKYRFWIAGIELKLLHDSKFEEESTEYLVSHLDCCRAIMFRSKQILTWDYWTPGYIAHVEDLMFCQGTVKDKCMEVECLHRYELPNSLAVNIIKRFALTIEDRKYDSTACLLLLVVAGIHRINNDLGKCLNQSQARYVINALQTHHISDLPCSTQEFVELVYKELCSLAYKPHIVTYWNMSYSFIGIQFVHSSIIKNIKTITFDGDPDVMLNACSSLCEMLYLETSILAKDDMEMLVRHMPLTTALQCCTCLLSKNKEQITQAQMDIVDTIYRILVTGIRGQLFSLSQENNLADILHTWKFIDKIKVLKEKLFGEYENVVLTILESSSANSLDIVIVLVDEHGFFTEPPKLRRLIQITAKSKLKEVNDLFFALAKHHKVKEQLLSLSREDIYDIFEQLTTDQSHCSERDQSFSFVCRRLNDIWGLPQMESPNYKEVWDEIMVKEFKKYTMQQLINKLDEINNFSARISHFGDIFVIYFKSIMDVKDAAFKPQDILLMLGEQQAKPRIKNMLTAQLFNLVIETLATQYRTDIFGLFLDMLHDADFWLLVNTCHGDFACHVYENECLQRSKACFVHIVNRFKELNVSYEFVSNIHKDIKSWKAFQALLECHDEDLNKWLEEAILKFRQEKEKIQKTKQVLENIFEKIRHERLKEDMSELLQYIKSKEKDLMCGSLTAKDCINIWKGFEQLPELCQNLEEVIHSNLFWNVSLEQAMHIFIKIYKDSGKNNDISKDVASLLAKMANEDFPLFETDRITILFLKILSSRDIVFYKNMWIEILENTALTIGRILDIFGTTPDIIQEVELAKRVLRKTQNTLQRINSVDKVQFKVDAAVSTLAAFNVELNDDFSCAIQSFYQLQNRKCLVNDFNFEELEIALVTVFRLIAGLNEETINFMNKLRNSTSPINLLQDIVDKDIRILINAEEVISEQQVRETTVSNLIDVKTFVRPLVTLGIETCQELIFILESQTKNAPGNPDHLTTKVPEYLCRLHHLESLHNKVENRIKQTGDMVIENIIQRGLFAFKLDSECNSVTFEAKYSQDEKGRKMNENETRPKSILIELRTRAILFKHSNKEDEEKLSKFVDYIDGCLDISECLFELYSSGHFQFMTIDRTYHPNELQATKVSLTETLTEWTQNLIHARETHFLLNFLPKREIQNLFNFLENKQNDQKAILSIARYIHPDMNIDKMKEVYGNVKTLLNPYDERSKLLVIGLTLDQVYVELGSFERTISSTVSPKISETVPEGRLLVAHLAEGSNLSVKTVLSLYMNTTQRVPEANQVLFCTRFTVWEEINLLINRCLGANSFYQSNPLFCIANVEFLSNEIQFALIETLQNIDRNQKYLLALVYRGSANHPFIEKLYKYVTSVTPATDAAVKSLFQEHCDKVLTVTSDRAGQGKSSFIEKKARQHDKCVQKLHISGPIKKHELLERLQSLNIKERDMLHIDIGAVDDPTELDTFIFELILLKHISAGRISISLKTDDIKIEIGNTINDSLKNSLQITLLFRRKQIIWKGFSALSVSKIPESSVQVVCKYLKAMEDNVLDKTDFQHTIRNETLSQTSCRNILIKYVSSSMIVSFPVINTFLYVLADQLKNTSQSAFFKVSRLSDMVGSKSPIAVTSKLVNGMLQVSQDFALYRSVDNFAENVKVLFGNQMEKKIEDFTKQNQQALHTMLQNLSRTSPKPFTKDHMLVQDYALTSDNLLKMILIMLRTKSKVPVIIMGETGCGKTSLIRYLANVCEVSIDIMNIHSGISELDIIETVVTCNRKALEKSDEEQWLFLDEINTSESIGVIGDIICHHTCLGKELAPNLIVMAACNPYCLRTSKAIATAGLDSKVKTDELSKLVYKVLPLPEMLVEYVLDFGKLSEADEKTYIYRMTENIFDEKYNELFADLISASQSFVRTTESASNSVSLRDVQRCKLLTKWFTDVLLEKKPLNKTTDIVCDTRVKSIILSLAHCYHCRFSDKKVRKEYRLVVARVFMKYRFDFGTKSISDLFLEIIRTEQRDLLERMILPPGIACNSALLENVFVIFVSIFNRIPIFVVGKPGCSKSLAIQLIRSNLRGQYSTDNFFKSLPQLYCVSFQGSESSTSDGILKVFEKAEKYQEANSREDVLSVVILDEIGLAEISRFNPLKVLHNLLEPGERIQPNVAVVGISNWALDASKMNRAVHLSCTDMDILELRETAVSISDSFLQAGKSEKKEKDILKNENHENNKSLISSQDIKKELSYIAEAYVKYTDQIIHKHKHFHGLRDYYALVKYISRMFSEKETKIEKVEKHNIIFWGLERNFGGLSADRKTLQEAFSKCISSSYVSKPSVMELLIQNINDPIARHLMLITTRELVLGILEQKLGEIGCSRKEVIYGSQFEEDLTDDYNYRILSRIILCMEEGVVLILKDLESVYGSLYDMLNQNYTVIGKKKNCRVALGAYSNPICHVADSFRCIVLMNETKLDFSDPPFLNRFEKQYLNFSDILGVDELEIIKSVGQLIEDLAPNFKKEDVFPIYNEDLVASLILKHIMDKGNFDLSTASEKDSTEILKKCKQELLWVIKPEIIVQMRSLATNMFRNFDPGDVISDYFSLPLHDGLIGLIQHNLDESSSSENMMCIVFTNSNVHAKITDIGHKEIQVEKLGAFKSEKQLSSRIQYFWDRKDCGILVVQCNAKSDEKHILLTKLVIESQRQEYLLRPEKLNKQVYLVVHLDRSTGDSNCLQHLNFLSQWHLVMLDSIEKPTVTLPEMCNMSLMEAVKQRRPLNDCLKEELIWAFTRIKYGSTGRDIRSLKCVLEKLEASGEFLELLDLEIWASICEQESGEDDMNWLVKVAQDRSLINTSATFIDAMERFVLRTIKIPLGKFIYKFELTGILDSYFVKTTKEHVTMMNKDKTIQRRSTWRVLLHDDSVFNIRDIPDASGPECYLCDTPDIGLIMPFSRTLFDVVEASKDKFLEVAQSYRVHCLISEDDQLPTEIYEEVLSHQKMYIMQNMPDLNKFLYPDWKLDYLEDFCNRVSFQICRNMPRDNRIEYTKLIMKSYLEMEDDPVTFIIRIHSAFWVNQLKIRAEMLLIDASLYMFPNTDREIKAILGMHIQKHTQSSTEIKLQPQSKEQSVDEDIQTSKFENIIQKNVDEQLEIISKHMALTSAEPIRDESGKINVENERERDDSFQSQMRSPDFVDDAVAECKEETSSRSESVGSAKDDSTSETKSGYEANDYLVEFLCKKMLPTTECFAFHKSIKQWLNKVLSALSLAYQVSNTATTTYSLKICCDLASELIVPFNLDVALLVNLGNILHDEYKLDSEEVFNAIKETVTATKLKGEPLGKEVCARLFSSYFVMCLEVDQESSAVEFLFTLITESDMQENLVHLFKAPLWVTFNLFETQLFKNLLCSDFNVRRKTAEDEQSEEVKIEMGSYEERNISEDEQSDQINSENDSYAERNITEDEQSAGVNSEIESFEERIILIMDEKIRHLFETKQQSHPFLVLLVDLFQSIYENELTQDDDNASRVEDETEQANLTERAFQTLCDCHTLFNRTNDEGVQYIAAIAYTKAFLNQVFANNTDVESLELKDIFARLNPVIADQKETPENRNLRVFFLKMLGRHFTLSGTKKVADSSRYNDVPFLRQYSWNSKYLEMCFEKKPLCVYLKKEEHRKYAKMCLRVPSFTDCQLDIKRLTRNAKTEEQSRLFLLSFAIKTFYVCQFSKPLNDDERILADWVIRIANESGLQSKFILLMNKLCGQQDFAFPELKLTADISSKQFCQTSFCISWIATGIGATSSGKTEKLSVFIRILVSPMDLKSMYIPGFHDENVDIECKMPLAHPPISVIAECLCGNKVASFNEGMVCMCCVCNSEIIDSERHGTKTAGEYFAKIPINLNQNCSGVRYLQPVSCHILQLITAASLIGSYELGTPLKQVEQWTNISEVGIIQTLWMSYKSHWEMLLQLLNINDHKLMVLLHVIVLRTNELFFQTGATDSTEALLFWENRFESIVSSIVQSRFSEVHTMINNDDILHELKHRCLEKQILETDSISDLPDDRDRKVTSLFRIGAVPTKMNFISELYPRRNHFPFLSQVIEHERILEFPVYALDIIRWHVATVSVSNYVMKKNDCLNMCVQDFIRSRKVSTQTGTGDVKKRFESFRNSWKHLKENLDEQLSSRMMHIHDGSKMSDCLLLDERSIVYEVLHELFRIQNDFLDKVLRYSSKTNALRFLFRDRGVAILPIVQVTNMTKEDLICFKPEWDELLKRESQCDLFYGNGSYVHYDFHSIEEQVALTCVRGKSFIRMKDCLPKIVFLDELHLNYSSMIQDLKTAVPQVALPNEITNSIRKRKEEDPKMVFELLTHLGIVMTVLKKTKDDADCALIDYVEKYKSLLGRDFPRKSLPNPDTDVKLCHIVSVSELLEELCADSIKNGLQDELRVKLNPHLQRHVEDVLKEEKLALTILKAVKRFIFRCANTADSKQMLKGYVNDDSFWPLGCFTEGTLVIGDKPYSLRSIIPDELLVQHTFAYLTTLETGIEKQQMDNIAMTQFATSLAAKAKSNPAAKKAQKQKPVKNFRNR